MQVPVVQRMPETQVPEPGFARLLWADTRLAAIWVLVRLYLAFQWMKAGWEKIADPDGAWIGAQAGSALRGFVNAALEKTGGEHPQVMGWYATFLREVVLPNAAFFAGLVAIGEVLVGLGILLGCFTGVAAFFGVFMNTNYLLAGSISTNPVLVALTVAVLLAWRVAGYWGLDRWLLPHLGVPGVREVRQAADERRAARHRVQSERTPRGARSTRWHTS